MANDSVKVKVPGLSGFDKSFKNILTTHVGTLTPLMCKYVMPGSKGRIKLAVSASLPPLASDTFMRASLKVEAFMVPMRLLYGGFESWLAKKKFYNPVATAFQTAEIPYLQYMDTSTERSYVGPGTLADYLGLRINTSTYVSGANCAYNIFPFLAYYRVVDDWYSNPRLSNPFFCRPMHKTGYTTAGHQISHLPYDSDNANFVFSFGDTFLNGRVFGSLVQRNYGADYFNCAMPAASAGSAQSINTSGGSFTIASLRASNSLQQWQERSGFAGYRLQDYVDAHFGAKLSSGIAERAVLLGSASYNVYSKGVNANADVTPIEPVAAAPVNSFCQIGSFPVFSRRGSGRSTWQLAPLRIRNS